MRIFIALILLLWPQLAFADWPNRFQNQANHNTVADQPQFPLSLVANFPHYHIQPVVQGNILITANDSQNIRQVVAYNLDSLQPIWSINLGKDYPQQPIIDHGMVYFGLINRPVLYAVNLVTGEINWQRDLPDSLGARYSPVLAAGGVFMAGRYLHRLTLDGEIEWTKDFEIASPLATDGTDLYVRVRGQNVRRLVGRSGEIVWSTFTNTTEGTQPVLSNDIVYVGLYQQILAIDRQSGQLRWAVDTGTDAKFITSLGLYGETLIAGTSNGSIRAIDRLGETLWINRFNYVVNRGNGWHPRFILAGEYALAQADATNQIIIEAATGKTVEYGQLMAAGMAFQGIGHQLLVATNGQAVALYRPQGWQRGRVVPLPISSQLDPVVIIPGIMGSWPINGVWQLDPITHSFETLIKTFEAAGYVKNQTLFPFPYDWHLDNRLTAQQLAERLKEIQTLTGAARVDVVAHSMGGLVARSYIQSAAYQDDIDQLIMLGTPNKGSVKAYLTWEAGETGRDAIDFLKEKLLLYESVKAGYGVDVVRYIQEKIPSLKQLLPIFDYLEKVNLVIPYSPCLEAAYPCNPFLEHLQATQAQLMRSVSVVQFIGRAVAEQSTLAQLKVEKVEDGVLGHWFHGKPIGYPDLLGMLFKPGDHTVLVDSAHLDGVEEGIVDANHTSLIAQAAPAIVQRLTGKDVPNQLPPEPKRFLFIRLHSPIDLLIFDEQGRRLGTDPGTGQVYNEIPGGFYSGNQTDLEYAIIPDPPDSAFKMAITGTANEPYKITASIESDTRGKDAVYEGAATSSQTESLQLVSHEASVTIEPLPPSSPPPDQDNSSVGLSTFRWVAF